ncbi:MAG: MATE family efflux transporter [Synergistaceae bacterium]|jgi:putative MATE family efflux protein|nr:MATE family efflux transporter [Synergistaceae bacterium]
MRDKSDRTFMEREAIPRLLARFAAPALAGMLANALYNIVDRIFVGHAVGAHGIAAIALSFPSMLFFASMAFLIGVGAASRISIQLGEKAKEDAERTLGNALCMAVLSSLIFWLVGRAFFGDILRLSGASDALFPVAASYLSIILYGIVFNVVSFSVSSQIRACGSPAYAMGSQIIGAVVNIALDAWFVIGLGKGVEGAALATVISQCVSMLWGFSYFLMPKAALRLRPRFILRIDPSTIARIVTVGTPACLVNLNFVLMHGVITNASSTYGGDLAVSATGIFMGMDSLLFMPAVAIAEACQPIVGYNYGAGRIDRVIATVKMSVLFTTIFYLTSFTAIMCFAEYMAMMFNSDDMELIKLTAKAMRVANIGIPVMGLSVVTTSFLQGLGMGREGLYLAALKFGIFLWIPLLVMPRYFGVYGAWGSFPISDVFGSAISLVVTVRTTRGLRAGGTERAH